jgi:hypothetical protein
VKSDVAWRPRFIFICGVANFPRFTNKHCHANRKKYYYYVDWSSQRICCEMNIKLESCWTVGLGMIIFGGLFRWVIDVKSDVFIIGVMLAVKIY